MVQVFESQHGRFSGSRCLGRIAKRSCHGVHNCWKCLKTITSVDKPCEGNWFDETIQKPSTVHGYTGTCHIDSDIKCLVQAVDRIT